MPDERRLELPGYPGGCDVVGNRANDQFQLDSFGEALLLLAGAARRGRLDADGRRAADVAADAISAAARAGRRRVGARPGAVDAQPADLRGGASGDGAALHGSSRHWDSLADSLAAEARPAASHPSGRWQRAAGDERVDAALLRRGSAARCRPATRERERRSTPSTRELAEDGYAYRYRIDDRPLGESEGAFLVCGFWMALAWHQQGEPRRATRWFERNRAACGGPGIYAEEYDIAQRQLRGNLPQAFVHALVLECAATLG